VFNALQAALSTRDIYIIEILLELIPHASESEDLVGQYVTLWNGHVDVIEELVKRNIKVKEDDNVNLEALYRLASNSNYDTARIISRMVPSQIPRNEDWFAIFRPKTPRDLDISLVHTINLNIVDHPNFRDIRFSPNGSTIAVYSHNSDQIFAEVFRVETGTEIAQSTYTPTTSDAMTSCSFSFMDSDSYHMAIGFVTGRILVWSVADDNEMQLEGHFSEIVETKFSQESKLLLSLSEDGSIKLWDVKTGQQLRTWSTGCSLWALAISRNGNFASARSLFGVVDVWDLDSGNGHHIFDITRGTLATGTFNLTEKGDVISGSTNGTLFIWERPRQDLGVRSVTEPTTTCTKVVGHTDLIWDVDSSSDGKWIASCSRDKSERFWDPIDMKSWMLLYGHPSGGC
jgi:general transcriptional corepressor TUP1